MVVRCHQSLDAHTCDQRTFPSIAGMESSQKPLKIERRNAEVSVHDQFPLHLPPLLLPKDGFRPLGRSVSMLSEQQ